MMNLSRGLIGAFLSSILVVLAYIVTIATFTFVSWKVQDADRYLRESDVQWWMHRIWGPIGFLALYAGITGLATFTPDRRSKFLINLGIICLIGIPGTLIIFGCGLTPTRVKGFDHPFLYLAEFLATVTPPLIAAAGLIVARILASEPRNPQLSKPDSTDSNLTSEPL